jgi:Ca2+-binding RTX toxin-like protein
VIAGAAAVLVALGVMPGGLLGTSPARAADGQGFTLDPSDLRFILQQIKIAEQHARTATPENPCGTLLGLGPDQIPNQLAGGAEIPWGLRTVDGSCNNLMPGQERFGAADDDFPRRTPARFADAEGSPPGFPAAASTSYSQVAGSVYDSQPRVISNLIVDQTTNNPAAVAAAGEGAVPDGSGSLYIANTAPDEGLSAPYNSWFTLFGQFFDHGLDLVHKSGGTVFVPLKDDDPLVAGNDGKFGTPDDLPAQMRFMVMTRATNRPGPDGRLGTADDIRDAVNSTTAYVDQSQTYTSHPSHQVFLREYADNTAGEPVSTGHLLTGPDDGLATWKTVKDQARTSLGIALSDADVTNVPLLATDPYGRFIPGANGYPQMVTATGLVEGDPAANGGAGVPVPGNAARTGHAFLDDIAHNAVPKPAQPAQGPTRPAVPALTRDTDTSITGATGVQQAGTYDDEMLDAHFVAGDGRINENIGLTAVHHVFHAEHNRLVGDIESVITTEDAGQLSQWQVSPGVWNGERLFQAARFVAEMEYQHLAFEEFARKVQPMVNIFDKSYDTSIDPAISAEFAHAVYRFGHSMLNEDVARRSVTGENRDIPLLDAFLNPPAFTEGGLSSEQAAGDIVRGMTDQVGNEIDEFVTEALRNRLLGLPLDLATLNIARARDTGVPRLNEARRQFHALTNGVSALAPYQNWLDFGLSLRHHESLINFVAAYGRHPSIAGASTTAGKRAAAGLLVAGDPANPETPADAVDFLNGTGAWADVDGLSTTGLESVDLWVGGLAEKQSPFGGLLGSTFNFIFETEMEDLQDGDRFYYLSRTNGMNLLTQLEGNSFAELISRNTDAANLPADVFSRPDLTFDLAKQNASGAIVDDGTTAYDERTLLVRMADGTIRYNGKLHALFVGTENADRVRSSEGDDTLRGNEADDRLEGGEGNDQIVAGSGQDIVTDTFGDDVLKGGNGHDAISSGPGFDINMGGLGNDFIVGGSDPTESIAGPGDDILFGGDSHDVMFGDEGNDWLEGGNQADLVQGDNGALFQESQTALGHDVLNGQAGPDDYDAESGDDIMVAGPGIERSEGMLGFDWVTHKNDPQAANDDMSLTALVPDAVDTLRDRFDLVEGLSGGNLDDVLRGDDGNEDGMAGHELDAAGIARIQGLAGLLPAGATGFTGGNIILGGEGNDTIEGRAGDDVIDGDVWLNVRLRAPDLTTPAAGDFRLVDSMKSLQADVFAGRMNAGDITIVRNIEQSPAGSFSDTAVFSGPAADYDVTKNADGTTTVAHVRGTAVDGTDTLRNVEVLRFADGNGQTAPSAPLAVTAAAGDAQATVTWTAPVSNGGSPITEYEIDVLVGGLVVRTVTDVAPTATSAVVTGLTNGTAYTFVVSAVNVVGSTDSVASAAVTPAAAATVPAAPAIGTASRGNASATVRWTPAANGGSAITSYQVEVRAGTTLVRTVTGISATATSAVVTGLTNGTAYTFRVRAVNALGIGALSAASATVTPATVPGVPTSVSATSGTAGGTVNARVQWGAPTSTGGSAVTGYVVRALRMSATGAVLGTVTSPTQAAATRSLTMTLPAGNYRFTVQAANSVGAGAQSARSNQVVAR